MEIINRSAASTCIARSMILLLLLMMTGCVGYKLNRDGLDLVKQGNYEAGLRKLSEASESRPREASYRADYVRSLEQVLNRLLHKAGSEKGAGRPDKAQKLFEQVLKLDPDNSRAKLGLEQLEADKQHAAALVTAEELLRKGKLEAAQIAIKSVLLENPNDERATFLQRYIEDQIVKNQVSSVALQSKFKKPVNLRFRNANLKLVFEALSRTSGINILLDRDVKNNLKTTVLVNDVSVEDTIDIILFAKQAGKKNPERE